MQISNKRRTVIKKALLCYTSYILDSKYKNFATKDEAVAEMDEAFNIINDIKTLEKNEQSEQE